MIILSIENQPLTALGRTAARRWLDIVPKRDGEGTRRQRNFLTEH
jgi:hypothetical protein